MVSGFLTSPWDHERIISGDAMEMRIELNESGFFGFSKTPKISSIACLPGGALGAARLFEQINVEAQRLQFLDHDVEGLGQARFQRVLALYDRLVHPRASGHVVALDGQHLLQRVGRAISL